MNSKANFRSCKIVCNWPPFIKVVYCFSCLIVSCFWDKSDTKYNRLGWFDKNINKTRENQLFLLEMLQGHYRTENKSSINLSWSTPRVISQILLFSASSLRVPQNSDKSLPVWSGNPIHFRPSPSISSLGLEKSSEKKPDSSWRQHKMTTELD